MQVWGLIRHGTRYLKEIELYQLNLPSLNGIRDEIVNNHKNGRGQMCDRDIQTLGEWDYNKHVHAQDNMTELGIHELRSLGKRLRDTFPEALKVDPHQVKPHEFLLNSLRILS